jgi:hypothetical protein
VKLCQKCIDAIKEAAGAIPANGPDGLRFIYEVFLAENIDADILLNRFERVSESECGFWAHYILNKLLEYEGWRTYKVLVEAGAAPP